MIQVPASYSSVISSSIGVQSPGIWNTNGSSASDIIIKAGTTLADGSVNASAKLLSLRTGIGASEIEYFYMQPKKAVMDMFSLANAIGISVNNVGGSSAGFAVNRSGNRTLLLGYGDAGVFGNTIYSANSSLDLFSTAGGSGKIRLLSEQTGAAGVGIQVGTATADGSVNATSRMVSIRTGIGGTEVEKAYIAGNGDVVSITGVVKATGNPGGGSSGTTPVVIGSQWTNNSAIWFGNITPGVNNYTLAADDNGNATLNVASAALLSFYQGNSTLRASLGVGGVWNQQGTDSTGTPGAATISKATGKSSIAIGASSVTITNTLCTAASRVLITPHARDATCKELIAVPGAGSFVVSGTANATAALPFSWEVSGII